MCLFSKEHGFCLTTYNVFKIKWEVKVWLFWLTFILAILSIEVIYRFMPVPEVNIVSNSISPDSAAFVQAVENRAEGWQSTLWMPKISRKTENISILKIVLKNNNKNKIKKMRKNGKSSSNSSSSRRNRKILLSLTTDIPFIQMMFMMEQK